MDENRHTRIALRGPAGEPVDFRRTLASHGVSTLPPNRVDEQEWTLARGPIGVAARDGDAIVRPAAAVPTVRRMLNLDEDLSGFYERAAGDPALAWVTGGAGRMLRSPTVFEDVVKTICTAADVRPAERGPQGRRPDDRAPLPPLRPLGRARVLALRHERLGLLAIEMLNP